MKDKLKFWIGSGLKDLIGRKQITDEYIAIYELVKNSLDAYAKNVKIIFENLRNDNSRIIIIDDGKGMDLEDIKNKWLGVAYSAKSDGTEDETFKDYRDKIELRGAFAGAKGVGRFSCDRLGKKLNLITIKNQTNAKIENISINWEDFEENAKEEFGDVEFDHEVLDKIKYDINHGTILEISGLRDKETWSRDGLKKLKHSLEKLVNPNQKKETFSIEIIAEEERTEDEKQKLERNKINGFVVNRLFETLDLKTTYIETQIIDNKIISTLKDRGNLIYKIEENTTYSIENISIFLFMLNRKAKINFKQIMGVNSVEYGSIFVYKNGYRIYPFGEEGEDIFLIDRRKQQGYNRFLGTRDLIGRIEITDLVNNFEETTSRDGGLIKNKKYFELVDFLYEKSLKRLERYVVEVIKWGDPIEEISGQKSGNLTPEITFEDIKVKILQDAKREFENNKINFNEPFQEIVNKQIIGFIYWLVINPKNITNVEFDREFFRIIEESQEKSTSQTLKKVEKQASKYNDPNLLKEVKKLKKDFKEIRAAKQQAEKSDASKDVVIKKKEKEKKQIEKKLEEQIRQTLFAREIINPDTKEFLGLQHQVRRSTNVIAGFIDKLLDAINKNEPKEKIYNIISKIDFKNKEIATLAEFVTKANFETKTTKINEDIIAFTNEYIENVYKTYEFKQTNGHITELKIKNIPKIPFKFIFRPIEIIIIIDNLVSNSEKAKATEIVFEWNIINENILQLKVADNGIGINNEILNNIFDFKYTTTNGSGLGLFHVKDIVNRLRGTIEVNNQLNKGVEFIITFTK